MGRGFPLAQSQYYADIVSTKNRYAKTMPKIDAPTVAKHRAQKEKAILEATVDLLITQGQNAVTPAAVAERAGLARTSVYQYHPSTASLVAGAIEELFRLAELEVASALAEAGEDPVSRLTAYVSAMLAIAQAGHTPNRPISLHGAPDECRQRIRVLHDQLMAPLAVVVAEFGAANVRAVTAVAAGAIQGAVQLVEHGADLEETTAEVCDFLRRALAS